MQKSFICLFASVRSSVRSRLGPPKRKTRRRSCLSFWVSRAVGPLHPSVIQMPGGNEFRLRRGFACGKTLVRRTRANRRKAGMAFCDAYIFLSTQGKKQPGRSAAPSRLFCHSLVPFTKPHEHHRRLRPGGGAAGGKRGAAGAVDDPGAYGPVQGLQREIGDLLVVRILPDGHAALGGVVARVLGVASQHGGHLLPGDRVIRPEQAAGSTSE